MIRQRAVRNVPAGERIVGRRIVGSRRIGERVIGSRRIGSRWYLLMMPSTSRPMVAENSST